MKIKHRAIYAFSLTEVLIALLVVSITLSALAPVLTKRVKQDNVTTSSASKQGSSTPVGGIIIWGMNIDLPDDSWVSCDGQLIPLDSKYDKLREMYGTNIPNLNNYQSEVNDNIANYIKEDIKSYIDKKSNELAIGKTFPKNIIAIWGTGDTIPDGWEEATEYRGVFLRGYGTTVHTQNNGTTIGSTSTTHTSGNLGEIQGDAVRNVVGSGFSDPWWPGGHPGPFFGGAMALAGGLGGSNINSGGSGAGYGNFDTSRVTPTANEIRPINKAVKYIKCSGGPTYTSSPQDLADTPIYTQRFRYIIKARV